MRAQPLTEAGLRRLRVGDIVRHVVTGSPYIVVAMTYPHGAEGKPSITAVKSIDVSNPDEWHHLILDEEDGR